MLYKIDLGKAIETQKKAIIHMKENAGLTDEQFKSGFKLCQMEDLVYQTSSGEQHKQRQIFEGMASLLGYNYQEAIEIEREIRQRTDLSKSSRIPPLLKRWMNARSVVQKNSESLFF